MFCKEELKSNREKLILATCAKSLLSSQQDDQQHPDVGDTVEEDHAVDQGRARPVPDPVHDVRVDREANQVGHSDAQDVEQVPLLFR